MTDAERKAIGYIVRAAADQFAATVGNKPIWDNRAHMREAIAQTVESDMALFDTPGVLASWVIAANQRPRS